MIDYLRTTSLQRLVVVCVMVLSAFSAYGDDLSERDKKRIAQLDKLSESLREVNVQKKEASADSRAEGRRSSEVSELFFRFPTCASGLVDNDKNGMLVFPMQVSGFSSTIAPGQRPKRSTGSDLVEIKVIFKGLIGEETPKAKIDLPSFNQGSRFPAADMVRDEIQKGIEKFLPEVEIEGRQKRRQKQLRVANKTQEKLRVFVHVRTSYFAKESGYQWIWTPSPPGETPHVMDVDPESSELLEIFSPDRRSENATAQRVRIWAESESGQRWLDHRDEDLWLVDSNPQFENERVYFSEQVETFDHTFEPQPGPHVFTERVLKLRNETPEFLSLEVQYRSSDHGNVEWETFRGEIPANSSIEPRNDLGMRIRASRIRFSAETQNRLFETHQGSPLWLVDQIEGQRAYAADKIGEFQYVFLPKAKGADSAVVTADNVQVKSETTVLGQLNRGEKYDVLEEQGKWIRVGFEKDGQRRTGWIKKDDVRLSRTPLATTPDNSRKRFRATSSQAHIQLGTATIARIAPGQVYDILEEKSGWYRVEVRLSDGKRQGWVRKSHGVVVSGSDS